MREWARFLFHATSFAVAPFLTVEVNFAMQFLVARLETGSLYPSFFRIAIEFCQWHSLDFNNFLALFVDKITVA
jgi:hypothetical protein